MTIQRRKLTQSEKNAIRHAWNNKCAYCRNDVAVNEYHIDHIVPINWYVKNSDDPWQANHYLNLQPLWAKENLSKNNKIK